MKQIFSPGLPRKVLRKGRFLTERIYYRYIYASPQIENKPAPRKYLLLGGEKPEKIKDKFTGLFPADRINEKICEADLICAHIFEMLGSGQKKLSAEGEAYQQIDWHSDFKSGYRWNPEAFYRDVRHGHEEGVDIKVPWELSRFQHLHILGQAYLLTGDLKYADEIRNQISDWIKNNKYCFGVNWRCAMDAAIRAVNWLTTMEYFDAGNLFQDSFYRDLSASLYEHGKFIRNNLEYAGKWTTNHYLADVAGLFFISVYCPFFQESSEWREFAFSELHGEMEKQVYPDGCSFESSTSYHRLALEMFFYSELLGRRAGIEFSDAYKKKLRKMFEVSMYCMKPSGTIPQIGDNDSGRFLQFSKRAVLDHSYLLSLATLHFKDISFKLKQFKLDEEAFWLFGEKGVDVWDSLDFRDSCLAARSFPDAGWYVMRHENNYCFISCGPNGGDGWHAHNDKLSFELVIAGHDVIVDPGTYVYTSYPEERDKFRSTGYHNTIAFDGKEQNSLSEQGVFSLSDRVRIIKAELTDSENEAVFKGEIRYDDVAHKRTITLDKKSSEWRITDSASGPHAMNARLLFHLSPEIATDGNVLMTNDNHKKIASIEVEGYQLEKKEYDYSPEYGVKVQAGLLSAYIPDTHNTQNITTYIRSSQ